MTTKQPDDVCANCHQPESAHRFVDYSDKPARGEMFLICPTSTFRPWPRSENERTSGQRQCPAFGDDGRVRCERARGHTAPHTYTERGYSVEWPKRQGRSR